jgi:hypothetical protein
MACLRNFTIGVLRVVNKAINIASELRKLTSESKPLKLLELFDLAFQARDFARVQMLPHLRHCCAMERSNRRHRKEGSDQIAVKICSKYSSIQ